MPTSTCGTRRGHVQASRQWRLREAGARLPTGTSGCAAADDREGYRATDSVLAGRRRSPSVTPGVGQSKRAAFGHPAHGLTGRIERPARTCSLVSTPGPGVGTWSESAHRLARHCGEGSYYPRTDCPGRREHRYMVWEFARLSLARDYLESTLEQSLDRGRHESDPVGLSGRGAS